MSKRMMSLVFAGAALAACTAQREADEGLQTSSVSVASARAELGDASGTGRATANATQEERGVRVRVAAADLAPGAYGAHVHMVGRCEPRDFVSAGDHWNPAGRQHGKDNPSGAHAGDLPNLSVGSDGRGSYEYLIEGAALGGGAGAMLDGDGASVVIHAQADDYRTDPSGNSGTRIACGVLR